SAAAPRSSSTRPSSTGGSARSRRARISRATSCRRAPGGAGRPTLGGARTRAGRSYLKFQTVATDPHGIRAVPRRFASDISLCYLGRVNDPIQTVPSDSGGAERERRVPLSEQAYVAIKRLILRRELQAGDRLTEALLCERLSLGRNPVHIALHRLQREGLVEIVPRKWIVVRGETLDGF